MNNKLKNAIDILIKKFSLQEHGHFLCRTDGLVLFAHLSPKQNLDVSSAGALIGGIWQASRSLAELGNESFNEDIYRLSFDSTKSGIYMLPATIDKNRYFWTTFFVDEVNPGLLKNKLRNLKTDLESQNGLMDFAKTEGREEFLFENITDDEIEGLFSVSG